MKCIHASDVIHRDIKAANILLDNGRNIQIADFNLASLQTSDERRFLECGTLYYMAPEIFQDNGYGKGVDLWSLGIVM